MVISRRADVTCARASKLIGATLRRAGPLRPASSTGRTSFPRGRKLLCNVWSCKWWSSLGSAWTSASNGSWCVTMSVHVPEVQPWLHGIPATTWLACVDARLDDVRNCFVCVVASVFTTYHLVVQVFCYFLRISGLAGLVTSERGILRAVTQSCLFLFECTCSVESLSHSTAPYRVPNHGRFTVSLYRWSLTPVGQPSDESWVRLTCVPDHASATARSLRTSACACVRVRVSRCPCACVPLQEKRSAGRR